MPKDSKTKQARVGNLLKNLSNLGTKTKHAWDKLSPKKLTKWLSPRKKHRENSVVDATDIETRSIMSDASWHACDASAKEDPFTALISSFPIPGLTSESPSGAPAARSFTWKLPKLPKLTVGEVEDEDDRHSTNTFTPHELPHTFCSSSSAPPPMNDLDDDPRDFITIPDVKDELLAAPPSHDDDYPRPLAPRSFLECMDKQATHEGVLRCAPNLGEDKAALECLHRYMRGELRGTDLFGLRGVGYKDPKISAFTRNQLIGIQTMLNFYVVWRAVPMPNGAHLLAWQPWVLDVWIISREVLDLNPYGEWNESMLADEDLTNDVQLHLQSLGKEITAEKLVNYLNSPDTADNQPSLAGKFLLS